MAAPGHSAGRVTGIGGVFVASPDPAALAAWYRDTLGMRLEEWGGAAFPAGPDSPPAAIWHATDAAGQAPSRSNFTLNLAVDDLDAIFARLAAHDVVPLSRVETEHGRFAAILDPDGTKVELWQPPSG